MRMSMQLRIGIDMKPALAQMFGETSGQIPAYSLHKIKNLMEKSPIGLHANLEAVLVQHLFLQNRIYREQSGNSWNCLTSNNLIDAIEGVSAELEEVVVLTMKNLPKEQVKNDEAILGMFRDGAAKQVRLIQNWFYSNYDELHYTMDGKIPWAVVQRLQKGLGVWIYQKVSHSNSTSTTSSLKSRRKLVSR